MTTSREPDDLVELENSFTQLAEALFSPGTVEGTLQQIVHLAQGSVDGCDAAGVLVLAEDGTVESVAASSDLVTEIDAIQIRVGEGPCIDAATTGVTLYVDDLIDDDRWPAFAPDAVAAGIRSVLALSVSADRRSALNLYAELPAAFGVTDRAKGQVFATLARLALDTAEQQARAEKRAGDYEAGLRTRELIGQAQGILMERERITPEQAFHVLRRASQYLNVKLRTVAESLVESGEMPDGSRPTPRAT